MVVVELHGPHGRAEENVWPFLHLTNEHITNIAGANWVVSEMNKINVEDTHDFLNFQSRTSRCKFQANLDLPRTYSLYFNWKFPKINRCWSQWPFFNVLQAHYALDKLLAYTRDLLECNTISIKSPRVWKLWTPIWNRVRKTRTNLIFWPPLWRVAGGMKWYKYPAKFQYRFEFKKNGFQLLGAISTHSKY